MAVKNIDAIRSRLGAITAVPWFKAPNKSRQEVWRDDGDLHSSGEFICHCDPEHDYAPGMTQCNVNATFIAHAPTDIAYLLAHTARLQAALRSCEVVQWIWDELCDGDCELSSITQYTNEIREAADAIRDIQKLMESPDE